MTDGQPVRTEGTEGEEEGRAGDRRGRDRRKTDRRAPVPPWRKPWALVAYGALAALAVVLLMNLDSDDEREPGAVQVVEASRAPTIADSPAAAAGPTEDAFRGADYERLIAQGSEAAGKRVRVELYCSAIATVALQQQRVSSSVAELADGQGRVPGAECKWGSRQEVRREDFLLLVPPALAERFGDAPVVEEGFVRRRKVVGEVEWIGRSEALALRTTGVLRSFGAPAPE